MVFLLVSSHRDATHNGSTNKERIDAKSSRSDRCYLPPLEVPDVAPPSEPPSKPLPPSLLLPLLEVEVESPPPPSLEELPSEPDDEPDPLPPLSDDPSKPLPPEVPLPSPEPLEDPEPGPGPLVPSPPSSRLAVAPRRRW
jgi:hypothetical protein